MSRSNSIVRFDDSNQVLITGHVEDVSDRVLTYDSKKNLIFTANDGNEFQLTAGAEVGTIEYLSAKRVCILGILDYLESPPILTVLGYRILPAPDKGTDPFSSNGKLLKKKKAA